MQRLRPDDHFMLLLETDATPMHIGALLLLDAAPEAGRPAELFEKLRTHLLARLPATPLLCVLQPAPRRYDADVWLAVAGFDADYHIVRWQEAEPMGERAVRAFVAAKTMERLDLTRPPFRIFILDRLEAGRAAILIKVHHALTDGVGLQTILGILADGQPAASAMRLRDERSPHALFWLATSAARFRRERGCRQAAAERRRQAAAVLKRLQADMATRRMQTPVLNMSEPTSGARAYATLSFDFSTMRTTAKALAATINDVFLAIAAGALRRYLHNVGDLPQTPLVANTARSYRRDEHGPFGNRIVAMHPHLATHIEGAVERLRAIQASMAAEKQRSVHEEAMLDQPEAPFGPRDRQRKLAQRVGSGAAVLPGNVTLSNVPGPAMQPTIAGLRQLANYPTPLLGSGRFLNITARRNGDSLDLGIMADPEKLKDLDRLVSLLKESANEYAELADRSIRQAENA